ncbi:MAG: hypothetical protein WCA64_11065, partial [Gallionella sp.]
MDRIFDVNTGYATDQTTITGEIMNRNILNAITVLAAALVASGCVSTGTFDKMQAGKDDQIAALQQQKAALDKQVASMQQDNGSLTQQLADCSRQLADCKQQNTAMQEQVGFLGQQRTMLLEASKQHQQQYDALVKDLS